MRSSATARRLQILSVGASCALGVSCTLACDRTPEAKPDSTSARPVSKPADSAVAARRIAELAPPSPDSAPLATSSYRLPASARSIAIGDIHGDLKALRAALRVGGAIDDDAHWIGKNLTVVQTGDQVDRGDQDREVLDEIEKLEGDAKANGGALYVLNGNHELMNASLDFRYVTRKSFASFADLASRAPPAAAQLPDEQRGRAAAFAPGGLYAKKLAKHLTVALVGDSLFAHGGVLPAHVDYGLERINREASAFLAGTLRELPPAVGGEEAPVWTRVYGSPEVDDATCQLLGRVLAQVGAKRLIVGHTVQKDGIKSACDGRLYRIDVGLSAYYGDNAPQVLEVSTSGVRVLDARTPSADKKSKPANPVLHSNP